MKEPRVAENAGRRHSQRARSRRCEQGSLPTARRQPWKAKFGGTDVSDVAKMKALENQNRRLERTVADSGAQHRRGEDGRSWKILTPAQKRRVVQAACEHSTFANAKRVHSCANIAGRGIRPNPKGDVAAAFSTRRAGRLKSLAHARVIVED